MVCPRCIMVVREELQRLGAEVQHIELGYAEIKISSSHLQQIEPTLKDFGFELIHNKDKVLVEEIKVKIRDYLDNAQNPENSAPLSVFLSKSLGKNYGYLSHHFSKLELRTIEKYVIFTENGTSQRIAGLR